MVKHFFIELLKSKRSVFFSGLIFFVCFNKIQSQVFYSVKPDYLKVKREANNLINEYHVGYPDTTIAGYHNYFPRNFLGNIGLASPNYILKQSTSSLGFNLYPNVFGNDLISEEQIEYYRSIGPYADITGIAGSKQLQAMKLLFTHTNKDRMNVTLRLNRYSSKGFYLKQQSFANNFYLSSNYKTKKDKVGYYFYFLNNSNRNQESGGIYIDTIPEDQIKFNKELLRVKLNSATRDNKGYKAMFNPYLKLNSGNDSTTNFNSYIQLKSKFNINTFKYKDLGIATDGFYSLYYLDTVKTYDSTYLMQLSNEINYSLLKSNKNFGISVGYKNEINQVWQKNDSLFMNNYVVGDLVFRKQFEKTDTLKKNQSYFQNLTNVQYIVDGANAGNYKLENKALLAINKNRNTNIYLNLLVESRSADYIYNYWVSNHFMWFNNGYKPQNHSSAELGINSNKKVGLSVLFQNTANYLYFDEQALPKQYTGNIQNIGVTAFYTNVFFKHLGVSLHNTFQSTSHESYVRIPKNIITARLFYSGNLFKNNLQLNIGIQGQSYSSFYGYGYMPATQSFYLQNKRMTGDYPFVDLYLNARIRPVSVFLRVENVLQGYVGANYALVPGYYQVDRAFRLGLTWMFFD